MAAQIPDSSSTYTAPASFINPPVEEVNEKRSNPLDQGLVSIEPVAKRQKANKDNGPTDKTAPSTTAGQPQRGSTVVNKNTVETVEQKLTPVPGASPPDTNAESGEGVSQSPVASPTEVEYTAYVHYVNGGDFAGEAGNATFAVIILIAETALEEGNANLKEFRDDSVESFRLKLRAADLTKEKAEKVLGLKLDAATEQQTGAAIAAVLLTVGFGLKLGSAIPTPVLSQVLDAGGGFATGLANVVQSWFGAEGERISAEAEFVGGQYDANISIVQAVVGLVDDGKTVHLERFRQYQSNFDDLLSKAQDILQTITSDNLIIRA